MRRFLCSTGRILRVEGLRFPAGSVTRTGSAKLGRSLTPEYIAVPALRPETRPAIMEKEEVAADRWVRTERFRCAVLRLPCAARRAPFVARKFTRVFLPRTFQVDAAPARGAR